MRSFGLAAILAALSLAACATRTYAVKQGDARVGAAMEQPFRDISVIREVAPETLVRAAEAPYRLRPGMSCEDLLLEVGALDAVLGADLDEPREEEESEIDLVGAAAGAVGGVLSLPYRGTSGKSPAPRNVRRRCRTRFSRA